MQKCIYSNLTKDFIDHFSFKNFMHTFKEAEDITWWDELYIKVGGVENKHYERHYHLDNVSVQYLQYKMIRKYEEGLVEVSRVNLFGKEEDVLKLEERLITELESKKGIILK